MLTITSNGLDDLQDYFDKLPGIADRAAMLAINDVSAGTGMTEIKKAAYEEINFPRGYLNNDRLGVSQRATLSRLEAKIRGRDRATSLARFKVSGQPKKTPTGRGVRIQVKPGVTKNMKNAWLVDLNNGNQGLAVRLKPGEVLNKTKTPSVQLAPNVYLLYGPSVDQVFANIADDVAPDIAQKVSREFLRQIARLTRE